MLRLIVKNGTGEFRDDAVNLNLLTFDVDNRALEALIKKSSSDDSKVVILGIEVFTPPAPPPQPITQPVIEPSKPQSVLIEDLRAKHGKSLRARLARVWHGKPKPVVLPG